MFLPPIQRISREDVPEAPDWISRLLRPLNEFLSAMYNGLNNGLTLQENVACQIKAFTLTAGAAAANNTSKFPLTMKRKPQYLVPLSVNVSTVSDVRSGSASTFTWNYDGVNVNITSISGLTNGSLYTITVLLI